MTHEPPAGPGGAESPDTGHLDLDQLADLDEGLLESVDPAAANAHVAGCIACAQRLAQIRSTRALLAVLPAEPMPASVAARIDAALAAAPRPTTIVPIDAKRRGWRAHPTAAGLGAAAAVAALVAALVVGRASDHKSSPGSTAAAGRIGISAAPVLPPSSTSGTNYTAANLHRTVPSLVAPKHAAGVSGGAAPSPGAPSAESAKIAIPAVLGRLYGSAADLDACVNAVEAGGPPVPPLAIDFGAYAGAPAVLVVLPGSDSSNVQAWFVGPNCNASDANLLHYEVVSTAPTGLHTGG